MWRRFAPVAVALVLAGLVAACSGSGDDGEAATTSTTFTPLFDPPASTVPGRAISEGDAACGLLTRGEVERAVGEPVNAGTGIAREGAGSSCTWSLRGSGGQNVSLAAGPGDQEAYERTIRERGGNVAAVSDGVIADDGTAIGLKDSTLILIVLNVDQTDAEKQATSRALIQAALARA